MNQTQAGNKTQAGQVVPMRRADRAVTDMAEIEKILTACKVCHLAFQTEGAPYVLPLNFGYALEKGKLTLYFHCAKTGRKLDLIAERPEVGFAIDRMTEDVLENDPCRSGCYFESVVGSGEAAVITDEKEACQALSALMAHQFGAQVAFAPEQAKSVCVFKIVAHSFSAKRKEP